MASTYSNLKIQLMTTGENSTTWGTVTNLNLGTALEEAIVGSADVTFASNNQTLTLTDTNASQTARNMRLRCTGTTGGSTRNLVVPSIEKPYIVKNDCADPILAKTAAGSGVTVPASGSMWVYSDGTNVVEVTTALGSPLSISSGGTGTNVTTYCNLTTNVTGVLPTANGGTGSNATTYCNLQSNVSGVLPIANGGTGSNTQSGARTALGLGDMAVQNGSAVAITGGNVGGITVNAAIVADGATLTPTELSYLDGATSNIQTQLNTITAGGIPSGTQMLFVQTAAPTGWTKVTTHNDKALRVVSGTASTGGSVAFSAAFASQAVAGTVGGTALTESQLPAHFHFVSNTSTDSTGTLSASNYVTQRSDTGGSFSYSLGSSSTAATIGKSSSVGSNATHTHSFTGTNINLAVQYVDVIIATKN